MARRPNYDVSGVVTAFLNRQLPERAELVRFFHTEIFTLPAVKELMAAVATEAMAQKLDPVNVLALGLNYGLAIGVLLEKERAERERRLQ
jgi:hypothetical protein